MSASEKHERRMSTLRIRGATPADLSAIEAIEQVCFPEERRSSRRSLRHSLHSSRQSVWIACVARSGQRFSAGVMVLHHHPLSLRIFSLAVLPSFQGEGIGGHLIDRAVALARRTGRQQITLEADCGNRVLTGWYERQGFQTVRRLDNYYSPGADAVRMKRKLYLEGV